MIRTISFPGKKHSRFHSLWGKILPGAAIAVLMLVFTIGDAWAIRVKDIAFLRGARDNMLIGFGLVVGLDGTGDSESSLLARRPLKNALERMAISINPKDVKGRSIAGVLVTANLPAFAKAGTRLDVTVDTLGDAISLRGGTLMLTLLNGTNQVVYATAQGPMTGIPKGIERLQPGQEGGGEDAERDRLSAIPPGSSLVATKGYVLGGGLVEREINLNLNTRSRLFINLRQSDFTTAFRLAKQINRELGDGSARAKDSGTVEVSIPDSYLGQTVELISRIENLEIVPDSIAKVVVDERTGAIVMGQNVRISPIAISHRNLQVSAGQIQPAAPPPRGEAADPQAGQQARPPREFTEKPTVILFKGEVDLKEVVDGLNKIGASTQDLVQVLKIIKTAGAMHAELIIR